MKVLSYEEQAGRTLENAYGGWLAMFQEVAEAPNDTIAVNVPSAWEPLMWYLGARCLHLGNVVDLQLRRHTVEGTCAFEAVLVDALWKADMEWSGPRRHTWENEFPVASYSAFYRPEVMKYLREDLPTHKPTHNKCVLVPCAADKPYPAPMHKAVREAVGADWEIIVATGVLGLVPESLWSVAPMYDSGLPNQDRVSEVVAQHLAAKHGKQYGRILVYSDHYAWAISRGFGGKSVGYLFGSEPRSAYLDLLAPEHLGRLRNAAK